MTWFQALPIELAEILEIPAAQNPHAVLVSEGGLEVVSENQRFYLYEGKKRVSGVNGKLVESVLDGAQMLHELVAQSRAYKAPAPLLPLWVVYECKNASDAEFWRQTILSRGFERHGSEIEHTVVRKGHFVLAQIHGRANSRLLQKGSLNSLYAAKVNTTRPEYVPDGEAQFPVTLTPGQALDDEFLQQAAHNAKQRALQFFNSVVAAAGIHNLQGPEANHHLTADEVDRAKIASGFDTTGFKRLGAALGDPLFLAGLHQHGNIRQRLRGLLRRGTESTNGSVKTVTAGAKTATEIRDIYHTLIQDFETDAPKHFDLLKDAVKAVAYEHPKLPAHQTQSAKTWHNSVSGALSGATNATQSRLTAKWVVIFAIVAAHQHDLTPTYTGVSPEHLFFWIIYGSPNRLTEALKKTGSKLNPKEISYYPRLSYEDPAHRAIIYEALTSEHGLPGRSDDWENNFLARAKHDMLSEAVAKSPVKKHTGAATKKWVPKGYQIDDEVGCLTNSENLAKAVPQLRLVQGYTRFPGERQFGEHQWCETPQGEIVDPYFQHKFPDRWATIEYRPSDEVFA